MNDRYYLTGPGNKLGAAQGVGWVNELLSRLTGRLFEDHTQTNHSLYHPLDRQIYFDGSHDNQIVAILAALGLLKCDMRATHPDPARTFSVRRLVSFAGHVVVERMQCSGKTYVRLLINDRVQSLAEVCSSALLDGRCLLHDFVASQAYAQTDGQTDYLKCGTWD